MEGDGRRDGHDYHLSTVRYIECPMRLTTTSSLKSSSDYMRLPFRVATNALLLVLSHCSDAPDDHVMAAGPSDWPSSYFPAKSLGCKVESPDYFFPSSGNVSDIYVDLNDRENPSWEDLKATLIIGANSYGPALGSTIAVNHARINNLDAAYSCLPNSTLIHTPTSTYIWRPYFDMQTRWYQEDKNTQMFRMFPGDDTICNSRRLAPRVEAFNMVSWKRGDGWYQFSGRYTFVRLRAASVFQIKHNRRFWSMQLLVNADKSKGTWNLVYQKLHDASVRQTIQKDILHKSFDIRIIDDGTYHKVFIDGNLRVKGNMTDRLDSEYNKARWGFYSPGSAMDREILMFVTDAFVGPYNSAAPSAAPTPGASLVLPTHVPSQPLPSMSPTATATSPPMAYTASPIIIKSVAPSWDPSAIPSLNRSMAIRSCVRIIRATCRLRQYYLGHECWLNVIDAQCPGLESYKDEISQSFEKAAYQRCIRALKRRCSCGSGLINCARRVSQRVCKIPVSISDQGAALFRALWKRLEKRCRG